MTFFIRFKFRKKIFVTMKTQVDNLIRALDSYDSCNEKTHKEFEETVVTNLNDIVKFIISLNAPYETLLDSLVSLISSGFIQNIVYNYLQNCLGKQLQESISKDEYVLTSQRGKMYQEETRNDLWNDSSVKILKITIEIIATLCERIPTNFELLQPTIDRIGLILNTLHDDILTDFFNSTLANYKIEYLKRDKNFSQDKYGNPPENFRNLPLIPKLSEIKSTRNLFLRPNLKNGAFDDVEHYLDIHFRLLREDYVGSIRDGLIEYLAVNNNDTQRNKKKLSNLMNIRVYKNVEMLNAITDQQDIVHQIKFEISEQMKRIRWETSKRLIEGSLLCFTNDNFKTAYFATVFDRYAPHLYSGKIIVKFDDWLSLNNHVTESNNNFTMIESLAYFESYRHTLESLKSFNECNFPFKKHIVYSQNELIDCPRYLRENHKNVLYDFRPLIKSSHNIIVLRKKEGYYLEYEDIQVPEQIIKGYVFSSLENSAINVIDQKLWPSAALVGLDRSQYEALQLALTHELVVIQGPPGTGK